MYDTFVPHNKWAKLVKDIAGNKCVICGSTKRLQAHHIMLRSKHPELANDLNNGLCLCQRCHYLYHNGKYSYDGDEWQGIQLKPVEEYQRVQDFKDNYLCLVLKRETIERIQETGESINGFINRLVIQELDRIEVGNKEE